MKIIYFLILAFAPPSQAAEWNALWGDCFDLAMPQFQASRSKFRSLLRSGDSWQASMTSELAGLDHLANVTCRAWAENPNGTKALSEFTREYSSLAEAASKLEKEASEILLSKLLKLKDQEDKEAAVYGAKFASLPCGIGMLRTEKVTRENLKLLRSKFEVLRDKCPNAANEVIAKGREHSNHPGSTEAKAPVPVNSHKPLGSGSDITGGGKPTSAVP